MGCGNAQSSALTRQGHTWHQWWPGIGSVAMTWLVNRRQRRRFAGVLWRGRSGALRIVAGHVGATEEERRQNHYFTFDGIHGGLDEDALGESLADASVLYKQRRRSGWAMMLGDFNVDMLSTRATDPWRNAPGRERRRAEQRTALQTVLDVLATAVGADPPGTTTTERLHPVELSEELTQWRHSTWADDSVLVAQNTSGTAENGARIP